MRLMLLYLEAGAKFTVQREWLFLLGVQRQRSSINFAGAALYDSGCRPIIMKNTRMLLWDGDDDAGLGKWLHLRSMHWQRLLTLEWWLRASCVAAARRGWLLGIGATFGGAFVGQQR
jgi:hypothetical protein